MTTYHSPVLSAGSRPAARRPLAVATGVGAALGVGDLLLQLSLPYPWADLANSAAVWSVVALVLGRALGVDELRSAAAGVVALVVAVEAYYLAAVVGGLAGPASLVAPTTVAWIAMGVVAGAGSGAAGAWSRDGRSWRAAAGAALGVAVLLAEAWWRLGQPATAALTAAVALVLFASVARGPVLRRRAALLVVPAVPVCYLLFRVAGFGG